MAGGGEACDEAGKGRCVGEAKLDVLAFLFEADDVAFFPAKVSGEN